MVKSNKTLLENFIDKRIRSYVEPEREGTPRGESIGLSSKKYLATLLMLRDLKLKDIAAQVGVSYGLLRKWTTEKQFKGAVSDHMVALLDDVWWFIVDQQRLSTDEDRCREIITTKNTKGVVEFVSSLAASPALADAAKYSRATLSYFERLIFDKIQDCKTYVDIFLVSSLGLFLRWHMGFEFAWYNTAALFHMIDKLEEEALTDFNKSTLLFFKKMALIIVDKSP